MYPSGKELALGARMRRFDPCHLDKIKYVLYTPPWLNWLEQRPFKARVPGSSPGGGTNLNSK